MSVTRLLLLIFTMACALLLPGEILGASKKTKTTKWKPLPHSMNDEMPRPDDTPLAWKDQAEQVVETEDKPYFTGFMVWNGRADRQYMPFHQWELRIASKQDLKKFQFRCTTLGPDMKPLLGREGHWVKIGTLRKEFDGSYKLNTSVHSAVRVECKWDGGEETYLSSNDRALPQPASEMGDQPVLLVLQPFFEYKKSKKLGIVQFYLRNDGSKPATEVKHTIQLKDNKGKVVHEHVYVPEDGTIEPGYAKEQVVNIKQCPYFSTIGIKTSKHEDTVASIDGGSFTEARDLQVAHFAYVDGKATAKVKNGTRDQLDGLVVNLQIFDTGGGLLADLPITVGSLAPGAIQDVSADTGKLENVGGWGFAYGFGGPEAAGQQVEQEPHVLDVDGVELTIIDVKRAGDAVKLKTRVTNNKGEPLTGLVCDVELQDAAGKSKTIELQVGDLGAGASYEGSVVADGIAGVAGVGMSWRTGG